VGLGALERFKEGRLVRYRPVPAARFWHAVSLLLRDSSDVTPFVRDALRGVAGVEAGFVFGSTAEGTARPDSDIDLFVIESPSIEARELNARLVHIGLVLERQVNAVRYTPQALGERLGDPQHPAYHFVRQTLTGPKLWVAGSLEAIRPLAAAAGVPLSGSSMSAA
jgi:predicted nucleotidyltransferase